MKVVIVEYGAGNIRSVELALRRLGVEAQLTADAEQIIAADRVLMPGQGRADATMAALRSRNLDKLIPQLRQPVLGICIGQQIMCRRSAEGEATCLGIFPCDVVRFQSNGGEKIPQVGWNTLRTAGSDPLLRGVRSGDWAYFIHSYYAAPCSCTIAEADYCQTFSAALHSRNFYATQFHPEKSGDVGKTILQNFLSIEG